MKVTALDHVNIIAADLAGTVRYYEEVFGLEARDAPPPLRPEEAQWMHDAQGRAILHVNSRECPRRYEREAEPGPTGPIHHVALACEGLDAMIDRLETRGIAYQISHIPMTGPATGLKIGPRIGLSQLFILDPNGVLFELNFREDRAPA